MPNNLLAASYKFPKIQEWLINNLINSPITAIAAELSHVPKEKGIYFWFMRLDGYKDLSKHINITEGDPRIEKEIAGTLYHLVYIGSAGTGKSKGGHLKQRLNWHITQVHSRSSVCSGTLSTFRAGIGSVVSDDLIDYPGSTTERKVNQFFEKYFKIFWIVYENPELIDDDEKILIDKIRPLFNISNNPEAWANAKDNSTIRYRQRRNLIYENTRKRLQCNGENEKNQREERMPSSKAPSYEYQLLCEDARCKKFTVSQHQSIAKIVRGISGLPTGPCRVRCSDSMNVNNVVYAKKNGDPWRTTGSNKQNIYTYFANVDTGLDNQPRWMIIQSEMKAKKIPEIIVTVCSNNEADITDQNNEMETADSLVPIPPPPNFLLGAGSKEIPRENEKKKLMYIIPCSKEKQTGGNIPSTLNALSFNELLSECRKRLLAMYNAAGKPPLNWDKCMPAYDRYNGRLIYSSDVRMKLKNNPGKVLIVSGLFGIIRPQDMIPYYDLSMADKLGGVKVSSFWHDQFEKCEECILNKVLLSIRIQQPGIKFIHLLAKEYQDAFCEFTSGKHHPALNSIPGLISPPSVNGQSIDNYGWWKGKFLNKHL